MPKKKKKSTQRKSLLGGVLKVVVKVLLFLLIISILLPLLYRWVNPPVTPLMLIRKVKNDAPIKKEWRDIEDISHYMVDCAVASEDNNFLAHRGFDWGAVQKAINEKKLGKRERGASTISQQTAKNVFLWPGHSWLRKAGEVYFTFWIETFWSKERIMEVYLNVIEMGDGIYGAEAAAQHYFRKPASKLNLFESAMITACYPAPLRWNPSKPTDYILKRTAHIGMLTAKIGRIKFDEESIAKAKERYAKRKTEWYELKLK